MGGEWEVNGTQSEGRVEEHRRQNELWEEANQRYLAVVWRWKKNLLQRYNIFLKWPNDCWDFDI